MKEVSADLSGKEEGMSRVVTKFWFVCLFFSYLFNIIIRYYVKRMREKYVYKKCIFLIYFGECFVVLFDVISKNSFIWGEEIDIFT